MTPTHARSRAGMGLAAPVFMRIHYDRGTLVLEADQLGEDSEQIPGAVWDPEVGGWRVPADRYGELIVRIPDRTVREPDETWTSATLTPPALRWYQAAALAEWRAAGDRGVIALPTGAGKTLVAIAAIAALQTPALVLVPTRVLLDQWAHAIARHWPHPVGRLGDGEHRVAPITVATYASAISWAPRIGDRFGLVVVDEAHHVGAWCRGEVLEMLVAPARLGLTATLPPDMDALAQHVGPAVYSLSIEDLAGDALAPYDLVAIPIALTRQERVHYRELRGRFTAVYAGMARAQRGLTWTDFVRSAARYADGRAALAAWRDYRRLIAYPDGKRDALQRLLARHRGAPVLVFTRDNATAYAIAREFLITPITQEIGRAERVRALDRFRRGEISALVSAQVLDEGLDVPDAEIAIVVGGSSSARRHVQRIGRVLRPRDGKRAKIYELVVEESHELDDATRRRRALAAHRIAPESPAAGGAP